MQWGTGSRSLVVPYPSRITEAVYDFSSGIFVASEDRRPVVDQEEDAILRAVLEELGTGMLAALAPSSDPPRDEKLRKCVRVLELVAVIGATLAVFFGTLALVRAAPGCSAGASPQEKRECAEEKDDRESEALTLGLVAASVGGIALVSLPLVLALRRRVPRRPSARDRFQRCCDDINNADRFEHRALVRVVRFALRGTERGRVHGDVRVGIVIRHVLDPEVDQR